MHTEVPSHNPRVLLVEDDPTTRTVLAATLEAEGFLVYQAENGAEGLDQAGRDMPDIVITDVIMPELDGFEVCRALRSDSGRPELPILVMTSLDDVDSIRLAYEAGATDFIGKPVNRHSISYRLRYMLRAADNVRALQASKRRLAELAYNDQLTGLPNRIAFMDALLHATRELGEEQRLLVASVDIDHFKRINDTLGALAGDRVLTELAKRLQRGVERCASAEHEASAMVARMGGDQFAAILALEKHQDVAEAVAPLVDAFAEPVALFDNRFYLQATVGVAVHPDNGDAEALLRRADAAVHYAKIRDAGGVQLYSEAIEQETVRKLRVESDLRTALTCDEFALFYQPKVDVTTGAVRGVEALVRWFRADGSMVSPMDFIPVAEDTGLIVPLGELVLRKACQQARIWQEAGARDFSVAVNLSARQFEDGELPRLVERVLAQEGVSPDLLSLEITESVLVENPARSAEILGALRELGVTVALDDFGTGYSSLGYLKDFPLDVLKIDRAFVRDLPGGRRSAAIANAIMGLAGDLGLSVVAEGVETEEQLAFFSGRDLLIQGYLFSKPLPADDFDRWLAAWCPREAIAALGAA